LRSAVGLDDAGPGLVFDHFELGNVAIEFPCVLSDQLVAFPDLDEGQLLLLRGRPAWRGRDDGPGLGDRA